MKHLTIKNLTPLFILSLINTVVFAQDSASVTTQTTKSTVTSEQTFMQPWVWVVGAAVIIIIIVALTRGSSSKTTTPSTTKDEVTYTKKVSHDEDPS